FSVNVFVPNPSTREHLLYLTALLNSRPLWQWYGHHAKRRGVGLEINGRALAQTPIRRIDFTDAADRRQHDELVELAGQLMRETGRVRACTHQSTTPGACKQDPNTDATGQIEGRIDRIVCRLYGLPEDSSRASMPPATT
ncbi:MAG: hypothetical protein JW888_16530, partial [Pirellulales bacterium]|nr:hypothetical protein [Pirellulales bacterium]